MNANTKQQGEAFYTAHKAAVDDLAQYLGVPPMWIVAVWHRESSLNPQALNSIGASGLNQMLPSTLSDYNLTGAQYRAMSVAGQVAVMKMFFAPARVKVKRSSDLYLYNFIPAAIIQNVPMDFVLGEQNGTGTVWGISKAAIYAGNSGLDFNHDGKITRQDVVDDFESRYDDWVKDSGPGFFLRDLLVDFRTYWGAWLIVLIIICALIYFVKKHSKQL